MYYYGFRYYSSWLGRWVNRDPIGERGRLSLYGFVLNDPMNWLDPVGLKVSTMLDSLEGLDRQSEIQKEKLELKKIEQSRNKTVQCEEDGYWLKVKKNKQQVPFAIGVNFELLAVHKPMWFAKGLVAGVASAYTFFPDSCELAIFTVRPTTIEGKSKEYPTSDEYYGINGKSMEDYFNRKPKNNWWEAGELFSFGGSIEFAYYAGNLTPGYANANSFTGIFHTVEYGGAIASFAFYIGEENPKTGGNWFGGTKGVGYSFGLAKVGWNYQFAMPPLNLEQEFGEAGKCLCYELTDLLLN